MTVMLHMMKLSVGTRDVADLQEWQSARAEDQPPLRHRTRSRPKRAAEIVAGGSIYWVIGGLMLVRQRIVGIVADQWEDGTSCAGLLLHARLVPVETRAVQPFQGWRYLAAEAAPADIRAGAAGRIDPQLPDAMRRELRLLCLI